MLRERLGNVTISAYSLEEVTQIKEITDRAEYYSNLVNSIFTWLLFLGLSYLIGLCGFSRLRIFAFIIFVTQLIPTFYQCFALLENDFIPLRTALFCIVTDFLIICTLYIAVPALIALFFEIDLLLALAIVSAALSLTETAINKI